MKNPMYISDCVRKNGVTYLTVGGHELTEADQGKMIKIVGVSVKDVNGEFPIAKVVPPDTIQILQPDALDIPAGVTGGAIAIDEPPVAATGKPAVPPKPAQPIAKPPQPSHPMAPSKPGGQPPQVAHRPAPGSVIKH